MNKQVGFTLIAALAATPLKHGADAGEPLPQEGTYAVVVHKDNPFKGSTDEAKTLVKQLYLKTQTAWPDGSASEPFGRKEGSDEEVAFFKNVLGMSDAELTRHWIKMKNSKGETPPRALGSSRLALKYAARNKGGFTVVKASEAEDEGVRVLFTF